ncbi:MAG: hypothetical protein JKY42_03260 [Flavobacteriales bacterium]|nr:hypothetical protein [Flavobacteriales bacterium]
MASMKGASFFIVILDSENSTMGNLEITVIEFENENFQKFIEEWESDVENFFPHYSEEDAEEGNILMLRYDNEIAGMYIYQYKGNTIQVDLDYMIPKFRDLGIGKMFFEQKRTEFKGKGFKSIVSLTDNNVHRQYLVSLGFKLSEVHPDMYEIDLH